MSVKLNPRFPAPSRTLSMVLRWGRSVTEKQARLLISPVPSAPVVVLRVRNSQPTPTWVTADDVPRFVHVRTPPDWGDVTTNFDFRGGDQVIQVPECSMFTFEAPYNVQIFNSHPSFVYDRRMEERSCPLGRRSLRYRNRHAAQIS